MKKRRVYGAISVDAYQKALEEAKQKKERLAGNSGNGGDESKTRSSSPPPTPNKPRRSTRRAKSLILALVILSTYAAGATWRWGGKWYEDLTIVDARRVVDDDGYSDDQVNLAMMRIRTEILLGIRTLGRATEKEGRSGDWAVTHIENTMEQIQELFAKVRDR